MRITKQNKIIVGVISLVLVLTVGYALFSETLNINGTAKASGNFNLIFDKATRIKEVGSSGATVTIEPDKKVLTINVPKLEYPTAYVEYSAVIKNEGTIDAILKGIRTEGLDNNDIKITYSGIDKDQLIKSNESRIMRIKVMWAEESKTEVDKLNFKIYLDYEQVTNDYVPPKEEMTRDMFVWDSETVVAGLSHKGVEYLKNNGGKLVIPEGTTEIASPTIDQETGTPTWDKGFSATSIAKQETGDSNRKKEYEIISNIIFPSTLEIIGVGAFAYQMNLKTSLVFPEGLKIIEDGAFNVSGTLGDLVIPNNVEKIGRGAFIQSKIKTLKLGDGLKEIGERAFYFSGIEGELIIPGNVEKIGAYAFTYNLITGELVIPDSVKELGRSSFDVSDITSVKLGKGLRTINSNVFNNCAKLTGEIYIPDNIESINESAFGVYNSSSNKITSISISKNTTYVSNGNNKDSFYNRPTPTIRD